MKKLLVLLAVLFCLSFALFAAGAKEEKVTTELMGSEGMNIYEFTY